MQHHPRTTDPDDEEAFIAAEEAYGAAASDVAFGHAYTLAVGELAHDDETGELCIVKREL